MKKILVLTVLAGMGHIRVAESIEKGIKEVITDVEVKMYDPLALTSPKLQQFLNNSYLFLANYIPSIWGWIYNSKILYVKYSPIRWIIGKIYAKNIKVIIDEFNPNLIISTHPFIANGVGELKKATVNIPLVSVSTDYHVHPLGINKYVDLFILPAKEIAIYLKNKGIPDEKIKISGGLPIDPKFFKDQDKNYLRQKFGLEKKDKVVLILCGGFGMGMGDVAKLLKGFIGIDFQLQLLVVAGKNEKLRIKLDKIANQFKIKTKIFGFIENMEELMEVSDIVVTKPGGASISETLYKGLPVILTKAIPGQEKYNVNILLNEKVVIQPKSVARIPSIISNLFTQKDMLQEMQQRIKEKFANVKSVYNIASILKDINWTI